MAKLTDLGRELRKLRIDKGELLRDMAQKIGVSPAFLSAVELGEKTAPASLVEKIARAYDLPSEVVVQLKRVAAISQRQFVVRMPAGASREQREAAAILARRFSEPMKADEVRNWLSRLRESDDVDF